MIGRVRRLERIGATSFALVVLATSAWCQGHCYLVSIPALKLQANERITGFDIHVQSGMIAQLPRVPKGWGLTIDNDPSWNTNVSGSLVVGAAALDAEFFHKFLVIEKETGQFAGALDLTGEIIVTSDWVSEGRIKLGRKDFVLKTFPIDARP